MQKTGEIVSTSTGKSPAARTTLRNVVILTGIANSCLFFWAFLRHGLLSTQRKGRGFLLIIKKGGKIMKTWNELHDRDMHLTNKEEWMLNYLKENSNYRNGNSVEYISPTEVGRAYGESKGKKGYHSSVSCPVLLKLTKFGLIQRNENGHYKYSEGLSLSDRLAILEADIKELMKQRDVTSCGCKGVEIRMPKENVVTQFPSDGDCWFKINGMWAGSLYFNEREGVGYEGERVSGHKASLFLIDCHGTWYDEDGEEVSGYFYYKPNDED